MQTMPCDSRTMQEGQSHYLKAIVSRLQQLKPYRIILFGSQAIGDADEASDIDLIVVLDSEAMPATYREKQDLYLQVARLLRDIRSKVSVDLIVHTRAMYARFMATGGAFARQVQEKGVVLYEGHHP